MLAIWLLNDKILGKKSLIQQGFKLVLFNFRKLSAAEIKVAEKSTLSPDRTATGSKEVQDGSKSPLAKSPAKADANLSTTKGVTDAKSPAKKKEDNTIELKKDANGLGISIVGGTDTPLVSHIG